MNSDIVQTVARNLQSVRQRIAAAAERAGRAPEEVRLVAVTKYVDLETVRALLAAGQLDLGESRVQQLVKRAEALGSADAELLEPLPAEDRTPRWHMIGHLQRNKVRHLLTCCRIVHSLDSVRLANELEHQAARTGRSVEVFIELNVAGEATKSGAPVEELPALAETVAGCDHLRLVGLMTMAPLVPDPEQTRPCFARLRELLDELHARSLAGRDCIHLSMGMSNDYEVALEEGATVVRIGSALFAGL